MLRRAGGRFLIAAHAVASDRRNFGAFGDGEPLDARIGDDGRARLTGTVTADTVLRLRMTGDDD